MQPNSATASTIQEEKLDQYFQALNDDIRFIIYKIKPEIHADGHGWDTTAKAAVQAASGFFWNTLGYDVRSKMSSTMVIINDINAAYEAENYGLLGEKLRILGFNDEQKEEALKQIKAKIFSNNVKKRIVKLPLEANDLVLLILLNAKLDKFFDVMTYDIYCNLNSCLVMDYNYGKTSDFLNKLGFNEKQIASIIEYVAGTLRHNFNDKSLKYNPDLANKAKEISMMLNERFKEYADLLFDEKKAGILLEANPNIDFNDLDYECLESLNSCLFSEEKDQKKIYGVLEERLKFNDEQIKKVIASVGLVMDRDDINTPSLKK